jgi:tetratricopeptide (TPR) repeat protein
MSPDFSLLRRLFLIASFCIGVTLPAAAQEVPAAAPETGNYTLTENAGAYLAARLADFDKDFRASAEWYEKALESQPDDPKLLQGLLVAKMALGDFDAAAASAEILMKGGAQTPSIGLALLTVRAGAEDYAGLLALLAQGQTAGGAVDDLMAGWAEQGQGRMTEALMRFDKVIATPGFDGLGLYEKALALASAGDLEGADAILSGPAAASITTFRPGVIAHMQILSQLERNADALKLFDSSFRGALDEEQIDLRRRLDAGEPIAFDIVANAKEGIAEALFTFASAIGMQADEDVALAYARAALYLRPDETGVKLVVAEQLAALGQFELAAQAYALILPGDAAYPAAEIGRAGALNDGGERDAAILVLQALAADHGEAVQVQLALGDMLRRAERYDEALSAYDAGIALVQGAQAWSWPLHYNRAVCLERLGRFEEGVPSFRKALELAPNQPQVLNYLGYTWIDRGENLDEALQMIETAVQAAPDQGYIIDSLAWAYYRLGRFEEALAPMERASLLEPVDPIMTDHLGDVYWVNGRAPEARFQWRRALSFEPTDKDAERIRRKLELGLDAVLEQEKAGQ